MYSNWLMRLWLTNSFNKKSCITAMGWKLSISILSDNYKTVFFFSITRERKTIFKSLVIFTHCWIQISSSLYLHLYIPIHQNDVKCWSMTSIYRRNKYSTFKKICFNTAFKIWNRVKDGYFTGQIVPELWSCVTECIALSPSVGSILPLGTSNIIFSRI